MISLVNARYYLAIVDNGTLSAAAAQLGVSQPTLSQQLARLECYLGQRLLLRTPGGVVVTEAGRTFYRHARILAAQVERAEAELGSVGEDMSDRVSLGLATCGAAASLALPVLRRLRAEHKSIRLRLNDNFAGTLSEFIMTGRIDLALAYTTAPMAGVNRRDLFTEELVVVAPRTLLPARRRGATLPITELREIPTVMLSPVHLLRTVIERTCARAGFEPRVVAEIDSLRALLAAVAGGLGATVLPWAALGTVLDAAPDLVIHRLGPEPLEVTVSLCTSAQLPTTPPIGLVSDVVAQLVQDRLASGAWSGVRPCPD